MLSVKVQCSLLSNYQNCFVPEMTTDHNRVFTCLKGAMTSGKNIDVYFKPCQGASYLASVLDSAFDVFLGTVNLCSVRLSSSLPLVR